jgi:hypothetical protein
MRSQRVNHFQGLTEMDTLIRQAIAGGQESQGYKGSQGRYLVVNGRRRKLIEASGKVTEAGRIYYEILGIDPPRLYAYEQPLIDDKWVMGFSGREILVRRRVNGAWTITKEGENYFRFNRDEFLLEVPYVVLIPFERDEDEEPPYPEREGVTNITATEHQPRDATQRARMYTPLDTSREDDPMSGIEGIMRVGKVRQSRERGRPLAATIEAQEEELKAAATTLLRENTTIFNRETGNVWQEVVFRYDRYWVWDETRPFRISARRTNVYDEDPPTTEVILKRPLASRAVPDGFFRPWELHEDVFKNADHICVVQMLHSCHVKRPSGADQRKGITEHRPAFRPEAIEEMLDQIFKKLGYEEGKYPFERGWREDGATSEMVLAYCQRHQLKCFIYHRGGRVRSFVPEGSNDKTPTVVYGIWADHAYWFRKGSEAVKLAARDYDSPERRYDEFMTRQIVPPFLPAPPEPFDQWGNEDQLSEAINDNFAALRAKPRGKRKAGEEIAEEKRVFWTTDINGVLELLKKKQDEAAGKDTCFTLTTSYSDMDHLARINIECKEMNIVVRDVPEDAESFSFAAEYIARSLPNFTYRGESLSSFTEKVRIALLRRRTTIDREAIAREQDFKCALCDKRIERYEVDHIQPISDGGTDARGNLRALCLPCHAEVTRDQRLSVLGDGYYSELSQDVLEGFLDAPKPRQLVAGDGTTNCIEIDIKRCRRFVLQKLLPRLPVARVIDSFQPYNPSTGLGNCHFVYVDAGPPLTDYYNWVGYHGAGWYGRFNARYMVLWEVKSAGGPITEAAYIMTFTPGAEVTMEAVADMYDRVDKTLTDAFSHSFMEQPKAIEKRVKHAILAMTGSWLTQHRYDYRVVESTFSADAVGSVAFQRGNRLWSETEQLTNRTMYLWGMAALNGEHFLLLQAMRYARHIPRLKIRGVLVDSILVTGATKAAILQELDRARYDDGTTVYSCKARRPARKNAPEPRQEYFRKTAWGRGEEGGELVGRAGFGIWSNGRFKFVRDWRVVTEKPGLGRGEDDTFQEEMARLIVENLGGYVAGRGGSGKSHMLKILKRLFREAGFTVDVIAFTHVQAANVDGSTIRHFLHANARSKRHVIIIDESSMVSLRLWAALALMQFTGAIFVVLGDMAGQLPPIQDAHRLDYWRQVEKSDFMHGLCRGLRVELNKFRRFENGVPGDHAHFEFVGSIYPDKVSFEEALGQARERYPWQDGPFDGTTLVATNERRIAVNEETNRRLAPPGARFVKADPNEKAPSQPQDAFLWPGLILASATTERGSRANLKNGLRYRILEVGETTTLIRVDDEGLAKGKSFQMKEKEVVRDLRLQHAITYDGSQARTIYGPLRLEQTRHRHFSHRRLIVGLGRGPVGRHIMVA